MSKGKLITDQHEEIRRSVGRLQLIAQTEEDGLNGEPLRRIAHAELTVLNGLLAVHFAFEEEGGYLYWIIEGWQHLRPDCERLLGQHTLILTEVSRILGRVSDVPEDHLKVAVGDIADRIAAHDAAETSLLRRVSETAAA